MSDWTCDADAWLVREVIDGKPGKWTAQIEKPFTKKGLYKLGKPYYQEARALILRKRKRVFLDKLGWPVVTIKERPITNFIRLLLHARQYKYWEPPVYLPDPNVTTEGQSIENDH